ncbi:MAG: tRNA pseudouridine(55) synthase TruB [Tissierellia bacterium]|nr:tRNA pseudouridine(55) synthase TruB [Tissierellia bacterium]
MDGIINFNKPEGMTSHDAVNYFRRLLNIKRIGHTGTLDPDATGVLPICIGKATRVSEYLLNADKEYIARLKLGSETDTQDSSGSIIHTSDLEVSEEDIIKSFNKFIGKIKQVPPMYSALKYKGKKLYELAREGMVVERKPREVFIYQLKILEIIGNREVVFYTKCSRGTYIRTLCNDIGRDLGTYGHMTELQRVGVGQFKLEDSYSMEYLNRLSKDEIKKILLPIDMALKDLDEIILEDKDYKRVANGALVALVADLSMDKNYRVYCGDEFIGVGKLIVKNNRKYLKMDKVFI